MFARIAAGLILTAASLGISVSAAGPAQADFCGSQTVDAGVLTVHGGGCVDTTPSDPTQGNTRIVTHSPLGGNQVTAAIQLPIRVCGNSAPFVAAAGGCAR